MHSLLNTRIKRLETDAQACSAGYTPQEWRKLRNRRVEQLTDEEILFLLNDGDPAAIPFNARLYGTRNDEEEPRWQHLR